MHIPRYIYRTFSINDQLINVHGMLTHKRIPTKRLYEALAAPVPPIVVDNKEAALHAYDCAPISSTEETAAIRALALFYGGRNDAEAQAFDYVFSGT